MTRKLNRLDQKKQFALNLLVQAEYAERKVTDVAFGEYATEKLGFSVNRNNVAAAREVFDIPSTSRTVVVESPEGLAAKVVDLERRLHEVEEFLQLNQGAIQQNRRIG